MPIHTSSDSQERKHVQNQKRRDWRKRNPQAAKQRDAYYNFLRKHKLSSKEYKEQRRHVEQADALTQRSKQLEDELREKQMDDAQSTLTSLKAGLELVNRVNLSINQKELYVFPNTMEAALSAYNNQYKHIVHENERLLMLCLQQQQALKEIQELFICPITCSVAQSPVFIDDTGQVYDKVAAVKYVASSKKSHGVCTSPCTRKPISGRIVGSKFTDRVFEIVYKACAVAVKEESPNNSRGCVDKSDSNNESSSCNAL